MFGIMRNTRIFLAGLVAMLIGTSLHAQNMWDAYRYSQQFNEGTARSVAMGNALDKVKAVSNYVTDDIDNDGIYNAMKYLKLI